MRPIPFGCALFVPLLFADPAAANGRFPQSNQIIFSPTNPNLIVGRTTYAVLPSTDNGKTWSYLCEDALDLPSGSSYEDPELGLTASNALVAGLFAPASGLNVSRDLGCNWTCVGGPLANQSVVDTVVRPDAPHQVLALTKTFGDGGAFSQVFQSLDDGATWTALGVPLDPTFMAETLDVPVGDPMRIYVSGERGYGAMRTASLYASSDGGTTWTEHVIAPFDPANEDSLFIGGVDPTDENRVYVRSRALDSGGHSRLYVTTDGGQTFAPSKTFVFPAPSGGTYAIVGELLGFALSPDGTRVFVGSQESGLWSAPRNTLEFTQVNAKVQVQCLATRPTAAGPELWACSSEVGGFVFGKSTDDGVTFEPKMATVTSMKGLVACNATSTRTNACGADANASQCSCAAYQNFCETVEAPNACLGCGQTGATDAGNDGESDVGSSRGKSASACGCSVVGTTGGVGSFAGAALAAMVWRRRLREKRS